MRTACSAAVLALLLTAGHASAATENPAGLAKVIAQKLTARKTTTTSQTTITPLMHTTDFGTDLIGCITLTRWELADFGYRGHAFFCEESVDGEVLGAVLTRAGVVRCHIVGHYVGDGCYDFDICDFEETACVE